MLRRGFLLVYRGSEEEEPVTFYFEHQDECARVLGLSLCADTMCPDHDPKIGRHSHIPEAKFGEAQKYPGDDPERAGLEFRVYEALGGEASVVWHYYARRSAPPVIYYRRQKIVFLGASGQG